MTKNYQEYSENHFEDMAKKDPEGLVKLLTEDYLEPTDLTFAAEIAGKIKGDLAIPALLKLLDHEKPYVIEGALLGLSQYDPTPECIAAVNKLLKHPNKIINSIARDYLDINS